MSNKPFFSIVVPTFNRARDLQFALFCILNQTFNNFEIIVSDNNSSDNTKEIIKLLNDKRVKYFSNKKNLGFILNTKKAVAYATGQYIFLHGDDDFLLYKYSLQKIYTEINKHNPGYARVNYLCQTPDKKRIFDFRTTKPFVKNRYIPSRATNKEVLDFIIGAEPYFVSGIIIKNVTPAHIKIVDSEPVGWIELIFYLTKNYGACYISRPHIIASWSVWSKHRGRHPVYELRKGRLASENFLEVVKAKIEKEEYRKFLHAQMMAIYVNLFPIIKLKTGNKNILKLSRRITKISPATKKSQLFWYYLYFSLISPRYFLITFRYIYFSLYVRFSKVENSKQIMSTIKNLKQKYISLNVE